MERKILFYAFALVLVSFFFATYLSQGEDQDLLSGKFVTQNVFPSPGVVCAAPSKIASGINPSIHNRDVVYYSPSLPGIVDYDLGPDHVGNTADDRGTVTLTQDPLNEIRYRPPQIFGSNVVWGETNPNLNKLSIYVMNEGPDGLFGTIDDIKPTLIFSTSFGVWPWFYQIYYGPFIYDNIVTFGIYDTSVNKEANYYCFTDTMSGPNSCFSGSPLSLITQQTAIKSKVLGMGDSNNFAFLWQQSSNFNSDIYYKDRLNEGFVRNTNLMEFNPDIISWPFFTYIEQETIKGGMAGTPQFNAQISITDQNFLRLYPKSGHSPPRFGPYFIIWQQYKKASPFPAYDGLYVKMFGRNIPEVKVPFSGYASSFDVDDNTLVFDDTNDLYTIECSSV